MKNFVLLAGAAVLVMPSMALAKDYSSNHSMNNHGQQYTYKEVESDNRMDGEYRIEMTTEENFRTSPARSNVFTTIEGERLEIDGDTVYKLTADGQRFFAPNGSYQTQRGQVVVVEDGLFKRLETAPQVVMLDMFENDDRR